MIQNGVQLQNLERYIELFFKTRVTLLKTLVLSHVQYSSIVLVGTRKNSWQFLKNNLLRN